MLHLNTLTTSMVLTNLESFLVCSYVLIDCGDKIVTHRCSHERKHGDIRGF
jgi:hypothetical protein